MNENIKFEAKVKLGNYKGLKLKKYDDNVTEQEVMAQIDKILSEETVLETKTEGLLELGDTAVFDFEGFNEGVAFEGGKALGHEMEIGSGQFIPGFEDQMVGMALGEEKDINVMFPADYHEQTLAGAPVVFKVKVNEIKVSIKPELTDEFVESLGNDEKTVVEFKTAVANDLQAQKINYNKNQTIAEALNLLASTSEVDVPEGMIDHEFAQAKKMIENQAEQYGLDFQTYITLTGMTEEQVNEQLLNESKARVLNSVIIQEVTKNEKFEVSKEEIEQKYHDLSAQYGVALDEVRKHLNDDLIKIDIEFTKAVELIYDNIDFEN